MTAKQTSESFWARVHKTSHCWEWLGACNSTGYGTVGWGGKTYLAHRVAAWLEGLVETLSAPTNLKGSGFICHTCDNRKCCNPAHFFLGSYSDNQKDAYNKKRKTQPTGQHHSNAKLTNAQAAQIRAEYANGVFQIPLGIKYKVSQRVISLIVRNKAYL